MTSLGSLCSGFGGLDLGLERAALTVAWHVENDPHASTVHERHWPGIPNHSDLKTTDWSCVEPVDVLCGGYPCQPFSHAGRRRGEDDARHLWPFVCAAIRTLRPRLAILENVSGHRSLGFGRVLGDLAEIGYDTCWASVRASDVGAPHRRERVFILASPADPEGDEGWQLDRDGLPPPADAGVRAGHGERPRPQPRERGAAPAVPDDERQQRGGGPRRRGTGPTDGRLTAPADTDPAGPQGGQPERRRHLPTGSSPPVADADDTGGEARHAGTLRGGGKPAAGRLQPVGGRPAPSWGDYESAIRRWEHALGEPAPDPLDGRGRLNVDLTRWMMGFPPDWHAELGRTHALRGYGNAVQVQVAELVGRWALNTARAAA